MCDGVHDILGIHACALNGQAAETLESWWSDETACFCDGTMEGEGRHVVLHALRREFGGGLLTRVVDMDGSPAVVAFEGPEGTGRPRVVLRVDAGDRVRSFRIEHPV